MRVLELEIHNVRGISHLLLKPNGKNFVVWGPNGSGKSAVVDAIDFLLTGRVSRLTGKGTSGITLNKHGPHVDHTPAEATIRAIVQLPDIPTPIEIKRCMAHTNTLECDNSTAPHLKSIMALAQRGQHVLTRRDILNISRKRLAPVLKRFKRFSILLKSRTLGKPLSEYKMILVRISKLQGVA